MHYKAQINTEYLTSVRVSLGRKRRLGAGVGAVTGPGGLSLESRCFNDDVRDGEAASRRMAAAILEQPSEAEQLVDLRYRNIALSSP